MKNIKRIFISTLFTVILAGCAGFRTTDEVRSYNEPRYDTDPQIELDVRKVEIISEFTPSFTRPNVEHLFPISIEKTARLWGQDRLKAANYGSIRKQAHLLGSCSCTCHPP